MINKDVNEVVMDKDQNWDDFINLGYGLYLEKDKAKLISYDKKLSISRRYHWNNGALWVMSNWGRCNLKEPAILKRKIDEGE